MMELGLVGKLISALSGIGWTHLPEAGGSKMASLTCWHFSWDGHSLPTRFLQPDFFTQCLASKRVKTKAAWKDYAWKSPGVPSAPFYQSKQISGPAQIKRRENRLHLLEWQVLRGLGGKAGGHLYSISTHSQTRLALLYIASPSLYN